MNLFKYGFLLLIAFSMIPNVGNAQTQVTKNTAISTSTIISLSNTDRTTAGLKNLKSNKTLEKAAQMKAEDMAKKSYFAHNSPECLTVLKVNCRTSWFYFDAVGYNYQYAGENLAQGYSNSMDIEKAWMNSKLHKENILNSNYKEIGIGIAQGMLNGKPTTFVVQMFGTEFSKTVAKR